MQSLRLGWAVFHLDRISRGSIRVPLRALRVSATLKRIGRKDVTRIHRYRSSKGIVVSSLLFSSTIFIFILSRPMRWIDLLVGATRERSPEAPRDTKLKLWFNFVEPFIVVWGLDQKEEGMSTPICCIKHAASDAVLNVEM